MYATVVHKHTHALNFVSLLAGADNILPLDRDIYQRLSFSSGLSNTFKLHCNTLSAPHKRLILKRFVWFGFT